MSLSHFEIFQLPLSFDIDTKKLAESYRQLQRTVHPDKYANAPDRERRLAMQKAAQINEAFQTLKNPLTRALYILQLQGINTNDEYHTAMDGEFLMMQMELREQLAEMTQLSQVTEFLSRIEQYQHDLNQKLSQQFAEQNWQQAHDTVRQFQFFNRLHEQALQLEEDFI
jgi:molecular chaperone HscB